MTKQLFISPREADILENAKGFKVWHKTVRSGMFADIATARMVAEEASNTDGRKALLYAVADVCGVEASAMFASYCPKEGWNIGETK